MNILKRILTLLYERANNRRCLPLLTIISFRYSSGTSDYCIGENRFDSAVQPTRRNQ